MKTQLTIDRETHLKTILWMAEIFQKHFNGEETGVENPKMIIRYVSEIMDKNNLTSSEGQVAELISHLKTEIKKLEMTFN